MTLLLSTSDNVLVTFTVIAAIAAGFGALAAIAYSFLTKKMSDNIRVQTLHTVFQMMDVTRDSRHIVRDYVARQKSAGSATFPIGDPGIVKQVDTVCRAFDVLGLIDRRGMLDRSLIDEFYSVPFVLLWDDVLGAYVEDQRSKEKRGPTHFWELVEFHERVKCVPKNHPGRTHKDHWPRLQRNRRRCPGA